MPNAEENSLNRKQLIDFLNEDLAREYQAIIALCELFAGAERCCLHEYCRRKLAVPRTGRTRACVEDFQMRLIIWEACPTVQPKPVKTSDKAETMMRLTSTMRPKPSASTAAG